MFLCEPPTSRYKFKYHQRIMLLTPDKVTTKLWRSICKNNRLLLTDLLTVLIPWIDHSRIVRTFRQINHMPFIHTYLIAVQHMSVLKLAAHYRSDRTINSSILKPSMTLTTTANQRGLQDSSRLDRQLQQLQQYQLGQTTRATSTTWVPTTSCTSV